jgi:DNA gyrase subunit A
MQFCFCIKIHSSFFVTLSVYYTFTLFKIDITDIQAAFIINANIKKLSMAYLAKYKEEAANLTVEKNRLMTFLIDENAITQDIVNELKEINRKYGHPRVCRIVSDDVNSTIPKGQVQIAVTENNFMKKLPIGVKVGSINDKFRQVLVLDNTDTLLIFDDLGRMFSLPVHKIPFCDKAASGVDIRYMLKKFTSGISVIFPMSVMKYYSDKNKETDYPEFFIVTASANGMVKRMDIDDVLTAPPSGTIYAKLDAGDKITSVILSHSSFDIIIYSDNKAVRVNVNNIPHLKRNTKGNRLMQLSNNCIVEGLCVIDKSVTDAIVLTRGGKINRISIAALPISKRRTGSSIVKLGSKDSIGSVIGVNSGDSIIVKTLHNKEIVIPVECIPTSSSISSGNKINGFEKGDCVIYAIRHRN